MNLRSESSRSPLDEAWVVNTRSPRQAPELALLLEARGAHSVPYPCIDIAPPLDPAPLDVALTRAAAGDFDWLAFTSANAVEAVEARLRALGVQAHRLAHVGVAAVGPGTAAVAAERLGLTAALCPDEHLGEALAEQLLSRGARKVLVPQAERAREALARTLSENGVEVLTVVAYRTVLGRGGADVPRLLLEGRIDAVVFASPSAVANMAIRLKQEGGDWDTLKHVCVACIGPVTGAAARRAGLDVQVEPRGHTLEGVVEGLEQFRRDRPRIGGRRP